MLIELALATATTIALPAMTLSVHAGSNIPASLVKQTLEEAAAIWRQSGVTLKFDDEDCASGPMHVVPSMPIHVTFEDESIAAPVTTLPLGWIDFDEIGSPMRYIHLSLSNAATLMQNTDGVPPASRMTLYERNVLLSRVLGRALAHELGHYLLSSKSHTNGGLMKAHRMLSDFINPGRGAFDIDASQKALIAARLLQATARNTPAQQ